MLSSHLTGASTPTVGLDRRLLAKLKRVGRARPEETRVGVVGVLQADARRIECGHHSHVDVPNSRRRAVERGVMHQAAAMRATIEGELSVTPHIALERVRAAHYDHFAGFVVRPQRAVAAAQRTVAVNSVESKPEWKVPLQEALESNRGADAAVLPR